jgi:CIC family chloride channel protein
MAAGAAAGLAATFNAPLAGVMFGVEVLLLETGARALGALVVAAATATGVSRAVLGSTPAFVVPAQPTATVWQLLLYPGLGLAAAAFAILFGRALARVESLFAGLVAPIWLKPALGGLCVGLIALVSPQVSGMGFQHIEDALSGRLGFLTLVVIALAKIAATSLTVGSGAGGGVFAPLLLLGAAVGGAYGLAAHGLFPSIAAAGGANFALVGMAAVLAASVRAPVTAVLLVFEMTQDFRLLPALGLATVVSTLAAHVAERQGVYTAQLRRNGVDVRPQRNSSLLQALLVEDAMTPVLETVVTTTPLTDVARLFQETGHHGLIVTDDRGQLYGIVTLADLERTLEAGRAEASVGEICTRNVVTVFSDETLDDALRRFAALDVGRLPVVDREDRRRVIGILRRSGIVRAYARALAQEPQDDEDSLRSQLQAAVGAELAEFVLGRGDAAVGQRLRDVRLPADTVVISIHRQGRVVIPRGNVQLLAGDRVIILKVTTSVDALRGILRDGTPPAETAL